MRLNNEQEVLELVKDLRAASELARNDLMWRSAVDNAYYSGAQWISSKGQYGKPHIWKLLPDMNPDKGKLRVTLNRVTENVLRARTSTHPNQILADVSPKGKRSGPEDHQRASLIGDVLDCALEDTGFLVQARTANLRRCVGGTYGIGFSLESMVSMRDVGGSVREVPDVQLRAIVFPPHYLSLDPNVDSHDLLDHDVVLYSDIWTQKKAERVLNITLDKDDLAPVGQLAQHEMHMHELVGGGLFQRYRRESKSPGVRIHQLHVKTEDGRFGQMFIVLETKARKKVVNADDPSTPFGGNAMPLGLIRAHPRSDTHWGLSDVAMLRADQDILNLHSTLYHRIMQVAGRPKWIVDKRTIGRGAAMEDVRRALNTEVGGIVPVDMGRRGEGRMEPKMMNLPGPQPFLLEGQREHEAAMRRAAFRAPGHEGEVKSHVANSTFDRALDEADAPIGIRMQEDIETYQKMLQCLAGTQIKAAREQSYSTLRSMAGAGLDEMDLGTVLTTDHEYPPVVIRIRESSVRYRGPVRKRQDLENSVALGATNATEYRLAMATDLDTPTAQDDAAWSDYANKIARRVLLGEEFRGVPAGQLYGQWVLSSLRMAMTDPRAADPVVQQRIMLAIQAQQQVNLMDAFASDPELALQQQQAAQQAQPEQEALPDEVDLSEVLG